MEIWETEHKKTCFHCKGGWTQVQAAHRGGGVSIIRDVQNLPRHGPGQPAPADPTLKSSGLDWMISRDALLSPPFCGCCCYRKQLVHILIKVKAAKLLTVLCTAVLNLHEVAVSLLCFKESLEPCHTGQQLLQAYCVPWDCCQVVVLSSCLYLHCYVLV